MPTRSIERPSEDLEPGGAGTCRELGREPGLADARFAGDEHGRAAPRLRRLERALELLELALAPDEHLARASLHLGQYRAATTGWKGAVAPAPKIRRLRAPKDKALCPMCSRSTRATIRSIRRTQGDGT